MPVVSAFTIAVNLEKLVSGLSRVDQSIVKIQQSMAAGTRQWNQANVAAGGMLHTLQAQGGVIRKLGEDTRAYGVALDKNVSIGNRMIGVFSTAVRQAQELRKATAESNLSLMKNASGRYQSPITGMIIGQRAAEQFAAGGYRSHMAGAWWNQSAKGALEGSRRAQLYGYGLIGVNAVKNVGQAVTPSVSAFANSTTGHIAGAIGFYNIAHAVTQGMRSALGTMVGMTGVGRLREGFSGTSPVDATDLMVNTKSRLLTSTGGDIGKTNRLLEFIKKEAVTTPFQFAELTDIASAGALYGVDVSKAYGKNKNSNLLRNLGDLAAAFGKTPEDAMYSFVNEYIGANDTKSLRGRFNTSAGMMKAIARGRAGEYISDNTTEGRARIVALYAEAKASGAMERQAMTLTGKISNLKDAMILLGDRVGQNGPYLAAYNFFDKLQKKMVDLSNDKSIDKLASKLGQAITMFSDGIYNALSGILGKINAASNPGDIVSALVSGVSQAVATVLKAGGSFANQVAQESGAYNPMALAAGGLGALLGGPSGAMAAYAATQWAHGGDPRSPRAWAPQMLLGGMLAVKGASLLDSRMLFRPASSGLQRARQNPMGAVGALATTIGASSAIAGGYNALIQYDPKMAAYAGLGTGVAGLGAAGYVGATGAGALGLGAAGLAATGIGLLGVGAAVTYSAYEEQRNRREQAAHDIEMRKYGKWRKGNISKRMALAGETVVDRAYLNYADYEADLAKRGGGNAREVASTQVMQTIAQNVQPQIEKLQQIYGVLQSIDQNIGSMIDKRYSYAVSAAESEYLTKTQKQLDAQAVKEGRQPNQRADLLFMTPDDKAQIRINAAQKSYTEALKQIEGTKANFIANYKREKGKDAMPSDQEIEDSVSLEQIDTLKRQAERIANLREELSPKPGEGLPVGTPAARMVSSLAGLHSESAIVAGKWASVAVRRSDDATEMSIAHRAVGANKSFGQEISTLDAMKEAANGKGLVDIGRRSEGIVAEQYKMLFEAALSSGKFGDATSLRDMNPYEVAEKLGVINTASQRQKAIDEYTSKHNGAKPSEEWIKNKVAEQAGISPEIQAFTAVPLSEKGKAELAEIAKGGLANLTKARLGGFTLSTSEQAGYGALMVNDGKNGQVAIETKITEQLVAITRSVSEEAVKAMKQMLPTASSGVLDKALAGSQANMKAVGSLVATIARDVGAIRGMVSTFLNVKDDSAAERAKQIENSVKSFTEKE